MDVLNINVGVLGHVDSGKTSIVKSLSTKASTAAFDKNPQSKERGITLDLGFSAFTVEKEKFPSKFKDLNFDTLQFTLVDCPGHASLMKTIIGGSQIIDVMILVIDISKGIQTQTAECLVMGEIVCKNLLIVLNKIDLIPKEKYESTLDKLKKRISRSCANTKFGAHVPMVAVAARPDGAETSAATELVEVVARAQGMDELKNALLACCPIPQRELQGMFRMAVDHCFGIRGQGTVITGTVLSGAVRVGDTIEIPSLKEIKKVKSMQMFHQPVEKAVQGDRVGICVTQFDPKLLERGILCTPGSLPTVYAGIIRAHKIVYFKAAVLSRAKFHVSIGHDTVLASLTCFGDDVEQQLQQNEENEFDWKREYGYCDELRATGADCPKRQFLLLEFERPLNCAANSLVIGSRLDADIHGSMCRLAFHGRLIAMATEAGYAAAVAGSWLTQLRVFKNKQREGILERAQDEYTGIVRDLFKKETNLTPFLGLCVTLSSGERGRIEAAFGQSGKCKVRLLNEGFSAQTLARFGAAAQRNSKKSKSKDNPTTTSSPAAVVETTSDEPVHVIMQFRRYIFDPHKKMVQ